MFNDGRAVLIAVSGIVFLVIVAGWFTRPTEVHINRPESSAASEEAPESVAVDIQSAALLAQQQATHWGFVTVVITGVGLVALFATLVETQQVGVHARKIGEAQVRAYLGCDEAYLFLRQDRIEIVLQLKNYGQSPALALWCSAELIAFPDLPGRDGIERHEATVDSEPSTLSANQNEERRILWWRNEADGFLPDFIDIEYLMRESVIIQVYAKWVDVFDEREEMVFVFRSELDRHFVVSDNGVSVTKINLITRQEGLSL